MSHDNPHPTLSPYFDMTSIQSGANGQHEDELAELRRRVVADGYSSAHSCQHCEEVIIIPADYEEENKDFVKWRRARNERTVLVTEEEMRQRAAAGCKFWSMVSDELDYETLLEKQGDFAGMSVPQCSSSPVS